MRPYRKLRRTLSAVVPFRNHTQTEGGSFVLTESGGFLLLESSS